MDDSLHLALILLAAAVMVVIVFRLLKLPAMLGYLLVGIVIGPHGLGLIPDTEGTRSLAEIGVVFLMFSIGLEFSLAKLTTMRRIVFGLGAAQVALTMAAVIAAMALGGVDWRTGTVLGAAVAMSSTAIVSKMLADKLELNSLHGRQVIGILLFQDLAVVPFLILIPALAGAPSQMALGLSLALMKAAVVLAILLFLGQRPMRQWFHLVARQKSSELFVLNVLFITLGLASITQLAGLSLVLGAFIAGMLISETEYRYQVEDDIKPFRDVLLGLFFVTIGMKLNLGLVFQNLAWVALALLMLIALKTLIIAGLSRLFGSDTGAALRTGLDLAQGGEFGFVLLSLAAPLDLVPQSMLQTTLAAMVLSMLAAPFIIERSERIVRHFSGAEWLARAMELHNVAVQSMAANQHVVVCGYGRSGQNLARLLDKEGFGFIALDVDPKRVKEAAAAGEHVVYGDAARREVLIAAGLLRARALVVTIADSALALRILAQVRELKPGLPVVVRMLDDTEIELLRDAGATAVLAEIMEGSLMLASHTLIALGLPLNRVLRRIRDTREQRYSLLRGFFHGESDESEDAAHDPQRLLHSILVTPGAAAIGKTLAVLNLPKCGVEVKAVRRPGIIAQAPQPDAVIESGDVLVLFGAEHNCAAAEIRVMQG
ncbi:MAG TPA: monovalent cation:proton antiporter-2 (CPA2) family protein [Burkholderiales bacterium]|jgi:CPA2 family monovalent cation:H+ antiporter-2|nr:monovalent cation:proton antiporter-2 (CPA2) family protein [Burkholderiales bacterium]